MLNPKILLVGLTLVLASCSSRYTIHPPDHKLLARVEGNSVTVVNDTAVAVDLISPAGEGTPVTLAAGAASQPFSFTVEKWAVVRPGASNEIEIKDENPLLKQAMNDLVILLKVTGSPRKEAHLTVGDCFFESGGALHRTVRVSQFPLSGTQVPLCP